MNVLPSLTAVKSSLTTVLIIAIAGAFLYLVIEKQQLELTNKDLTNELSGVKTQVLQLQSALSDSNHALATVKADQARLSVERSLLEQKNSQAKQDADKLRQLLARHRLEYLAANKPGLIESRVNNGTKEVLDEIESITSITTRP